MVSLNVMKKANFNYFKSKLKFLKGNIKIVLNESINLIN